MAWTYAIDKLLDSGVRGRQDPGKVGDNVESRLQVLDALDHSLLIDSVVQIRVLEHLGIETSADGHAASRNGATSEVLAEGHGV